MHGRATLFWKWLTHNWPYLALIACVFIPMLWFAASLASRTGLLWSTHTPTPQQLQTFQIFIAGGLATAVTLVGALLTREHNGRERRRLQLETVVKSVEFLPAESQQRVSAVLSTMVLLGQQRIAVRILGPAWRDGLIDHQTATWIVNQVLISDRTDRSQIDSDRPDETAMNEASALLRKHAPGLADDQHPRSFSFPGDFATEWAFPRYRLDRLRKRKKRHFAKDNVLQAMGRVVTSQSRSWWCPDGFPPAWPTEIFLECAESDSDPTIRCAAAILFGALYDCAPDNYGNYFRKKFGDDGDRRVRHVLQQGEAAKEGGTAPQEYVGMAERITEEWTASAQQQHHGRVGPPHRAAM